MRCLFCFYGLHGDEVGMQSQIGDPCSVLPTMQALYPSSHNGALPPIIVFRLFLDNFLKFFILFYFEY